MIVKYRNHTGGEFILHGDDLCFVDPMQLHAWEWSYELSNRVTGYGGAASGFARWPRTFDLELRLRGYTHAAFLQRMDTLAGVADVDAIFGQPGRLVVTGKNAAGQEITQYLVCYLAVRGGQPEHPRGSNFATRTVTVLAVEPYWYTLNSYTIYAGSPETGDNDGKKYNYKYGYRYGTALGGNSIINTHYAPAPVRITVFGPASTPSITIGGNVYAVTATLIAGQRLIIDPTADAASRILIVDESGQTVNAFDSRDKAHDIFAPVQPGENPVIYSGDFDMILSLVQQRSELQWVD